MAIKCLACGHIDRKNVYFRISENLEHAAGETAPFSCVKCGSKNITSENVE